MQCGEAAFSNLYSVIHALIKSIIVFLFAISGYSNVLANNKINDSDASQNYIINDRLEKVLNNSTLPYISEVSELYQLRDYSLIWSDGQSYNNAAFELAKFIRDAKNYGLNPDDYDLEVIEYFLESTINDSKLISKSDVTFSHAYIKLANHLFGGKLNTSTFLDESYIHVIRELNSAIENEEITKTLEEFQPSQKSYKNLIQALRKYRAIDTTREQIKLNKRSLTIGDRSSEVLKVRKILREYGDYRGNNFESEILDETLVLALSNYQSRHGLEADGILGKKTVKELNKPVEERINQIVLNLERARNLPEFNTGRHLIINIPDYKLYIRDNSKVIFESRVVVGKKKNKTPVLSSELTEVILNPYWHVPTSIASNEIVPLMQEDPDYLYRNNMRLLGKVNNKTQFIDPESIDWANVDFANTDIRIRQNPGRRNSLGRIKFIFPNHYSVYLHDTPARNLFVHNQRAFSHGCIRVEDPFGLAEILLSDSESWSSDDLKYFVERNRSKTIKLHKPIPIHITYMTVWVDRQEIVHFRPDIYKHDRKIASNLYNAAH